MNFNLPKYAKLFMDHYNYEDYDNNLLVKKFKRGSYTIDIKGKRANMIGLVKIVVEQPKEEPKYLMLALVEYPDSYNTKLLGSPQYIHFCYLDSQYRFHITEDKLSDPVYLDSKSVNEINESNYRGITIDKIYYKDTVAIFRNKTMFSVA